MWRDDDDSGVTFLTYNGKALLFDDGNTSYVITFESDEEQFFYTSVQTPPPQDWGNEHGEVITISGNQFEGSAFGFRFSLHKGLDLAPPVTNFYD